MVALASTNDSSTHVTDAIRDIKEGQRSHVDSRREPDSPWMVGVTFFSIDRSKILKFL
jgi:hypothetical protein